VESLTLNEREFRRLTCRAICVGRQKCFWKKKCRQALCKEIPGEGKDLVKSRTASGRVGRECLHTNGVTRTKLVHTLGTDPSVRTRTAQCRLVWGGGGGGGGGGGVGVGVTGKNFWKCRHRVSTKTRSKIQNYLHGRRLVKRDNNPSKLIDFYPTASHRKKPL